MTTSQIPVACSLDGAELARRKDVLFATIRRDAIAITDVADGFVVTFARTRVRQRELEEMIAAERRCCPFLDFRLEIVDDTAIAVAITGTPEGKAYLASAGLTTTRSDRPPTSPARLAALGGAAWLAAAVTFACCLLPAAVVGVGAAYFDGAGLVLGLTGLGLFTYAIHRKRAAQCGC